MTTQGYDTRFGLGPQDDEGLATQEFAVASHNINKNDGALIRSDNMRGQRSPVGDYTQKGIYNPGGPVVMHPTPEDLDFLLPYILGATEAATDSFAVAENLPELVATVDKVLKVRTFRKGKVAQATFRSRKGEVLTLELQLEFQIADDPTNAGTFPDIASTLTTKLPYVHHQSTLTFDSGNIEIDNIVLVINNNLETDHHNNSQSRTSLPEGVRQVTLSFDTEMEATNFTAKLQDIAPAGVSGSTLVYTDGTDTLTFTLGRLQKPETPVNVQGKGSIRPQISMEAFEDISGSVPQIAVTSTNTVA